MSTTFIYQGTAQPPNVAEPLVLVDTTPRMQPVSPVLQVYFGGPPRTMEPFVLVDTTPWVGFVHTALPTTQLAASPARLTQMEDLAYMPGLPVFFPTHRPAPYAEPPRAKEPFVLVNSTPWLEFVSASLPTTQEAAPPRALTPLDSLAVFPGLEVFQERLLKVQMAQPPSLLTPLDTLAIFPGLEVFHQRLVKVQLGETPSMLTPLDALAYIPRLVVFHPVGLYGPYAETPRALSPLDELAYLPRLLAWFPLAPVAVPLILTSPTRPLDILSVFHGLQMVQPRLLRAQMADLPRALSSLDTLTSFPVMPIDWPPVRSPSTHEWAAPLIVPVVFVSQATIRLLWEIHREISSMWEWRGTASIQSIWDATVSALWEWAKRISLRLRG